MEPITRKEIYLNQIARNTGGSGGDTGLTPITREEHYFDAIVKNTASGGGGGSSLPAVTSADNGDVLTVVNGAWDKAAPSGGGSLADLVDVLIKVVHVYDAVLDTDTLTYEITKGDFATIYSKVMNGEYVFGWMEESFVSADAPSYINSRFMSFLSFGVLDYYENMLVINGAYGGLLWDANGIEIED